MIRTFKKEKNYGSRTPTVGRVYDGKYLAEELLERTRVELSLVDDLDGYLLSRGHVLGEFDLGEVTLSDGLQQFVFADVRLLGRPRAAGSAGGAAGSAAGRSALRRGLRRSLKETMEHKFKTHASV